jgi:hypothetical protein
MSDNSPVGSTIAVLSAAGAFVVWVGRFVIRAGKALELIDGDNGLVKRVEELEKKRIVDDAYERGRKDAESEHTGPHKAQG